MLKVTKEKFAKKPVFDIKAWRYAQKISSPNDIICSDFAAQDSGQNIYYRKISTFYYTGYEFLSIKPWSKEPIGPQ